MRLQIIGFELGSDREGGIRLFMLLFPGKNDAQIGERIGKLGIQTHGLAKAVECPVQIALGKQGAAEIVVIERNLGRKLDRLADQLLTPDGVSRVKRDLTAEMQQIGMVGRAAQALFDRVGRSLHIALVQLRGGRGGCS